MLKTKWNREKRYTLFDVYHWYKEKYYSADELSYKEFQFFKDVVGEFNMRMSDGIVEGEVLQFPGRMGKMYIMCLRRNPASRQVNWKATDELRIEMGLPPRVKTNDPYILVYYTDESFIKWGWEKKNARLKNIHSYKFKPTRGIKGSKEKLSRSVKKDSLLFTTYKKNSLHKWK